MIGSILEYYKRRRRERYLGLLRSRGLQLAADASIEDGFFLDPSHCYLISIGSRVTFAPNVRLIAHDASTKRLLGASRLGRIVIEDGCFLGDSVVVLPGVTIGRSSIIGAGSVVTRSIPPGSVAVGNPAKVLFSVEEYAARQRALMAEGRRFSEEYWIERANPDQIRELCQAVDSGPTFIT